MKATMETYENGKIVKTEEYNREHTRISIEGHPDIWFARRDDQDKKAEILTKDPAVAEALGKMAAENPDVITVLSEEGDEDFKCIAGKELIICLIPSSGNLEFWIEKSVEHE